MAQSKVFYGRTLLVVAGLTERHWDAALREIDAHQPKHYVEGVALVDCRDYIKNDPHLSKDHHYPNQVCKSDGFEDAVKAVLKFAARDAHWVVVVGCTRGKHRSPVVAAFAREILSSVGLDIKVVELQLVQEFLLEKVLKNACEWVHCASVFHPIDSYSFVDLESITNASIQSKLAHLKKPYRPD